jgi:phosphoserine phosphatase
MPDRPAFASVALDVDSTVSGIEGIDWLSARRGPEIATLSRQLTDQAMRGEITLESVYGKRLALIRPTRDEIAELAAEYERHVAPGCNEALRDLRARGVRAVLISGGIRQAIEPMALSLGFAANDLHAVTLLFDSAGEYAAFDAASPLTTQMGKPTVLESLALPRPILAVGDGATDLIMRPPADVFAAFTGFARREPVCRQADVALANFEALLRLVLTGG